MEETIKRAFANTFVMYYQSHAAHWNVEGMLFSQFHDFFGDMYEELFAVIDPFAEHIRTEGFYSPFSMDNLYSYRTAKDIPESNDPKDFLVGLYEINQEVLNSLNILAKEAESQNKQGLLDFVAGRIDAHKKHAWMLQSFLRG